MKGTHLKMKMATKIESRYRTLRDLQYDDNQTDEVDKKHVFDLYLPADTKQTKYDTLMRRTEQNEQHYNAFSENSTTRKTDSDKKKFNDFTGTSATRGPVVIFVHGGGWRRGDKDSWNHFLSSDINLFAAIFYKFHNLYGNVGAGFAKRGLPCAVMSYPLVTLKTPWILVELLSSYMCTSLVTTVFLALVALALFVLQMFLPFAHDHSGFFSLVTSISLNRFFSVFLFHGIFTNTCILLLMTYKRQHYRLSIVQVAITWICLFLFFMSFKHVRSIFVLFYVLSLFITQGNLALYSYTKQKITPVDQMKSLVKCIKRVRDIGKKTLEYDADSIYLVGHSAGGHICSMVGLDGTYVTEQGISRHIIKGVITISGVLRVENLNKATLRPFYLHPSFGKEIDTWREFCPLNNLRNNVTHINTIPPFMVVTAESDYHLQQDATHFEEELRSRGALVENVIIPNTGHLSIICEFDNRNSNINLADCCIKFILNS